MGVIDKTDLKILERLSTSAVYCFIDDGQKKVWLSWSMNLALSFVKQVSEHPLSKKDETFKNNPSSWTILVLEEGGTKDRLLELFYKWYVHYLDKGYTVLNKPIKYKVLGRIEPDFRNSGKWLYYVWLCTLRYKVRPLAVFDKVPPGEQYLKSLKKTNKFEEAKNDLTREFVATWKNVSDYSRVLKK